MIFNSYEELKINGYKGFYTISDLYNSMEDVPDERGLYIILRPENSKIEFVKNGTGGFFKSKDPNVAVDELNKNWIEDTKVIYIGKAGGVGKKATIKKRLKQYLNFGKGKKVGHWGGRYIWQIKDINDYLVCWKELPESEPKSEEVKMIDKFMQKYNKFPFANLTR